MNHELWPLDTVIGVCVRVCVCVRERERRERMGRSRVALIVSSWVIPISILVNRIVPDPYMDEIFHVPQAQQYCKANFTSWDPMITTPPGLYFLSLAHVASLFPGMLCIQPASYFFDACSTAVLRSTNGILAVICSILVYEIITCLRPSLDERKATLYAVILALYPLHWFFTFLYYTDVASLTAVLAMYFMSLKKNYILSALQSARSRREGFFKFFEPCSGLCFDGCTPPVHVLLFPTLSFATLQLGVITVFLRQTNVIWMLFVACTGVINCTQANQKGKVQSDESNVSEQKDGHFASRRGVSTDSKLRKRRSGAVNISNHSVRRTSSPPSVHSSGLFREIQDILLMSWHLKWELLVSFSPFFIVLVAFVAFVLWNGSVVLGAKEAHTVSTHIAQILYFSLVSSLFMAPVHFTVSQVAILSRSFWKNRPLSLLLLFLATTASFLSVHFFSIAHPYLLADNRHYPFYLWRKIIKAHWSMKYLLVPLYVYSWFSIFHILAKVQKKIWVLVYFLATAAVLIPAPLIEFRYYTIPFFFLVIHSYVSDDRTWLLMGLIFTAINVFTMTMFLFQPFHWDHEPGIQRFIW